MPKIQTYPVLAIATGDKLLGERVAGTTVQFTYAQATMNGTASRVTVTSGVDSFTFDISASYVGQASITTLGTITTGVWNGTAIANANLANSAVANLSGTNTGDQTNITGNAATVTTNANLTGPVTSTGNATAIANGAISNAMLANSAVANLSGTNTGDQTATGTPTASTIAKWDASVNMSSNNFLQGYTVTATSAGTKTLAITDTKQQVFTGSSTHTCKLPVVSTLALGTTYVITNISSGAVAVQSSGANVIQSLAAKTTIIIQSNATSGTGASVWTVVFYTAADSDITGIGSLVRQTSASLITPALGTPTSGTLTNCTGYPGALKSFQIFTSGTAATYTRPAGVVSILVEIIGGGGGGGGCIAAGSSSSGGGGGGAGGYARLWVAAASSTYTYTVGGGGAGGAAGTNDGTAGTTSTFSASSLQATGGSGGTGAIAQLDTGARFTGGGASGVGSNGNINAGGSAGGMGQSTLGNVVGGAGGNGHYGGAAAAQTSLAAGNNATGYGSGGSGGATGAATNRAGGNGSAGLIVVWEFS